MNKKIFFILILYFERRIIKMSKKKKVANVKKEKPVEIKADTPVEKDSVAQEKKVNFVLL